MKNKTAIYYSLILLALSLVTQMFTSYNYSYYVDEIALISLSQASFAKVIFLLFDGINDLFFGYLSDKLSFKSGKRKPWLIFGLPLFSVAFLFTFYLNKDTSLNNEQVFIYYLFITILFDNFSSLMYVNYNAMFVSLFEDTKERTNASSLKHVFELIGTGLALVTAPILKEYVGYLGTCVIYISICIIIIMISLMNIKENKATASIIKERKFSFKSTWKQVVSNKPFIWYLISTASFLTIMGTLVTILPFLIKYTLHLNSVEQIIIIFIAFIMIIFSFKGWTILINKKGHRFAYKMSFIFLPFVVFLLASSFNFLSTLINVIVSVPFIGGLLITPDLIMAEIIDQDFKKHQIHREAALMSISSFVRRIAFVIAALLLMLVSSFSSYQDGTNPGNNPEFTFRLISMIILPIIGGIGTLASSIYLRYSEDQN